MSVTEARTRIIIDSRNAQIALENLSKSMKQFENALGGTGNNFKTFSNGIKLANADVLTLTKSIAGVELALNSLTSFSNAITKLFKGAYDYSTGLESNAVGMSGILSSMTTLNGKTLEWNQAMSVSRNIMKELRETALQTASTAPELIDTFRALLGPGLGVGMDVSQVMKLTTVGVNAVKSMGLDGTQLVQELRSIIQGSIKPASSTLATALGISNVDVKNAINSTDGLFKFLMERLKGFEMSVSETSKTIKGRVDILTEALYQSIEKGSVAVFDNIKNILKELSDRIMTINSETGKFELNKEFIEQITKVSNFVNDIVNNVVDIGKKLFNNIEGIANAGMFFLNTEMYVAAFGTLVSLAGKFSGVLLKAQQVIGNVVGSVYDIVFSFEKASDIEARMLNVLQSNRDVSSEIAKYNNDILKGINEEFNANKKVNKELEKQKDLTIEIDRKINKLYANSKQYGNIDILNNIGTMKTMARNAGVSENDINKMINQYLVAIEKGGYKGAKAYIDAFRNGLRKYNIGDDVKAIINKSSAELSSAEIDKIFSARNKMLDAKGLAFIKEYDQAYKKLTETMSKAGIRQNEIANAYVDFNKKIILSGEDVIKLKDKINLQDMKALEQSIRGEYVRQNVIQGVNALGSALLALGTTYQYLTNDNESLLGSMAQWGIYAGTVITAIGQIGTAYSQLKEIVIALREEEALLKLVQTGIVDGIALTFLAGAMYSGYTKYQEYKKNGIKNFGYDETNGVYIKKEQESNTSLADFKRNELNKGGYSGFNAVDYTKLKNAYQKEPAEDKKGKRAAEQAERLRQKSIQASKDYDILIGKIDLSNNKLKGSYTKYQEEIDTANEKTKQWKKSLDELVKKSGGSFKENGDVESYGLFDAKKYAEALNAMKEYVRLSKEQADINAKVNHYENELKNIQNLEDLKELTHKQANDRRAVYLQAEIKMYEKLRDKFIENEDEKLKYETLIAEKRKALREAEESDGKVHWDNVLYHIKNVNLNLTETVNSTFDSMLNTFTNFGQNFLTEGKSIGEMARNMFKDFANQIWNMMMKLIMQGMVMRAILGLGGNDKYYTNGDLDPMKVTGAKIPQRAKGGLASGWTVVGEQGPELVNFSSPGRVYTAEQTKNALGGNGNVNIKIDLKNESGQQLQAEQTGTQFDGENYVLGIVLKAVATNKNNFRNVIKGVATT